MSSEPQRDPSAADLVSDRRSGGSTDAKGSDLPTAGVDASVGETAGAAPAIAAPPLPRPLNQDRNKELELEIFGGDSGSEMSEMEEMSSDEEEGQKREAAPKFSSAASAEGDREAVGRAARRAPPTAPSDDDSDEYLEHAPLKPSKDRRKRSAAAATMASGEDDDGSAEGKAKKPKKSRRKSATIPAPDVPFEQMTRSQQAEIIVGREFDEVLASISRQSRRRKAEKIDEAELDEMMVRLRNDMKSAALKDSQSVERKEPALEKLKMLPIVQKQMQKTTLYDQFIDNNILEAIKAWLEPLPDGSLPSLDIVAHLFEVLNKMPIITDNLRESGLGRVIKFYTLVPEERISSKLRRQAELLVAKWTRPIMQRSANYRDRHIRRADEEGGANSNGGPAAQEMVSSSRRPSQASAGKRPTSGGFQSSAVDVFAKRPAHSRSWKGLLPQPVAPHYRVAPPNQVDEALVRRSRDAHDHNKRYDKIIRGSQAKSSGRQKAG